MSRDDDRAVRGYQEILARADEEARRDPRIATALDELRACARLAYDTFGARGVVEFSPDEPGIIYIGQYDRVYPKSWPKQARKRRLLMRGRTHAELAKQAKAITWIPGVL